MRLRFRNQSHLWKRSYYRSNRERFNVTDDQRNACKTTSDNCDDRTKSGKERHASACREGTSTAKQDLSRQVWNLDWSVKCDAHIIDGLPFSDKERDCCKVYSNC